MCLFVIPACSRGGIPKTSARPPVTRVAPVTETLHATTVVDNYRWLEGDGPDVGSWTDAQNRYTRAVLDNLPGRKSVEDRLWPLMRIGSVSVPVMRKNRYFFAARAAGRDQPLIQWREGYLGADRTLVDPDQLDPTGNTAVAWFSPSEDGTLLAYGLYRSSDAAPALHLLEVDSLNPLPLVIPSVGQGVQWLPDGSAFVYQTQRNPEDPSTSEVRVHRMTDAPERDAVMYRGPAGALSRDGQWIVVGAPTSFTSNNLWLANVADFRKSGKLSARPISAGTDGRAAGTVVGGTLFLQTTKGAPRGRIVAASTSEPAEAHWRTIVAERQDAVVESAAFGRDRIAVTYRRNAASVVEVFDLTGKPVGTLALPGIGMANVAAGEDRAEAFIEFTSFNYPQTIFRVDLASPSAPPKLWMAAEVAVDPASVEVEQVWYPSKDGTKISMFLAHKRGLPRTGGAPTVLGGFGAFNVSATPAFSATHFPWFEAGGVVALPNLRGGGEYGASWHAAGQLDHKQNTVDDFISAAEWLIANKYTDPARLAAVGSTHGGLVVGAALTQRPDLFRAGVLLAPLLDLVRYAQTPEARDWAAEYGSPSDPRAFGWLWPISPYHHVKPGVGYPGILLTGVEHDAAVNAFHARKMAAALQAATASNPADRPVLLRVDRDKIETADALLSRQFHDAVDQRLFLLWQLGML